VATSPIAVPLHPKLFIVRSLAVNQLGRSASDVARSLGISGRGSKRLPREGKENPLVPPALLNLFSLFNRG